MADFSGSFTENFRTIISEKNSSQVRTSAIIRSSPSEMFWKYAANLKENTYAEVQSSLIYENASTVIRRAVIRTMSNGSFSGFFLQTQLMEKRC